MIVLATAELYGGKAVPFSILLNPHLGHTCASSILAVCHHFPCFEA